MKGKESVRFSSFHSPFFHFTLFTIHFATLGPFLTLQPPCDSIRSSLHCVPIEWNEERQVREGTRAFFTFNLHFISWSNRSPFVFLLSLLFNERREARKERKEKRTKKNGGRREVNDEKETNQKNKGQNHALISLYLYFALWYFVWVFFLRSSFTHITLPFLPFFLFHFLSFSLWLIYNVSVK